MKNKNVFFALLSAVLFATVASFAKELPPELSQPVKKVVSFTEITKEAVEEFADGEHPDIAIECREGTELPFKYLGKFGLFTLKFSPDLSLTIEKTFYLRFILKNKGTDSEEVKAYMSFDMKNWDKVSRWGNNLNAFLTMDNVNKSVVLETNLESDIEDLDSE